MTSRECYVYIQLPGSLEVVTCARLTQVKTARGEVVARLVYGNRYLRRSDAVAIDDRNLPLRPGQFETAALRGMFGAIRDAAPDHWGRMIIERELASTSLDELDYLLHSPEDRAGALSFGTSRTPPAPVYEFNRTVGLGVLREDARAIEEGTSGQAATVTAERLLRAGTSMGGARAKAVVEDGEGLWIAKFPMRDDRWNNAAVERGMLELARECGIETPESRIEKLGGESVLLVKRFDRSRMDGGYLRHRMVSALTVLGADEVERGRWSYVELADELGRWSERVAEDRRQLFRRMVFNALISNTDDHPRNHAMIAQKDGWRLSPAYDLTPEPSRAGSVERDLAMTVGEGGRRASRKNLMSAAERFALSQEKAAYIIDEMLAVVAARWNDQVKMNGASAGECTLISSAFLPEGFEF